MSSTFIAAPLPEPSAGSSGVGLGYGIAITVGILVLVSTIMLASYVCVRVKGGRHHRRTIEDPPAMSLPHPTPTIVTLGLDDLTIDSYPKFVYGGSAHGPKPVAGPCPICLSKYRCGEVLRSMPECEHSFHAWCVDEWLRVSGTCPLCRNSPVPSAATTPMATPLSELIPLAVHGR